jgi:hypothetical protein
VAFSLQANHTDRSIDRLEYSDILSVITSKFSDAMFVLLIDGIYEAIIDLASDA